MVVGNARSVESVEVGPGTRCRARRAAADHHHHSVVTTTTPTTTTTAAAAAVPVTIKLRTLGGAGYGASWITRYRSWCGRRGRIVAVVVVLRRLLLRSRTPLIHSAPSYWSRSRACTARRHGYRVRVRTHALTRSCRRARRSLSRVGSLRPSGSAGPRTRLSRRYDAHASGLFTLIGRVTLSIYIYFIYIARSHARAYACETSIRRGMGVHARSPCACTPGARTRASVHIPGPRSTPSLSLPSGNCMQSLARRARSAASPSRTPIPRQPRRRRRRPPP